MKKHIFILLLLPFFYIQSNAQVKAEDITQMLPKWKVGDVRVILSNTKNKTWVQDSLVESTASNAEYKMRIITESQYVYQIAFASKQSNLNLAVDLNLAQGSKVASFIDAFMSKFESKVGEIEYNVNIDRINMDATTITNKEEVRMKLTVLTKVIMFELQKDLQLQAAEMESLNTLMNKYIDSKIEDMYTSTLNTINSFIQPYSTLYPINGSYTESAKIGSGKGIQGSVLVSGKTQPTGIEVRIDYQYNKKAYLDVVKAQGPEFANLTEADVDIEEYQLTLFNPTTSWISKHVNSVKSTIGIIKTSDETVIRFQ